MDTGSSSVSPCVRSAASLKQAPVLKSMSALGSVMGTGSSSVSPCVRSAASLKQVPVLNSMSALGSVMGTTKASHVVNACTVLELNVCNHQVFDGTQWRMSNFRNHPRVQFQLKDEQGGRSVTVSAIADSGAQSNLWGFADFQLAGFRRGQLRSATVNVSAANNQPMNIVGSFTCILQGASPEGEPVSCRSIVYVNDAVSGFFLSYETMLDLRIIDDKFPRIGNYKYSSQQQIRKCETAHINSLAVRRVLNSGCPDSRGESPSCNCPQRTSVPERPTTLPFPAIPENNEKMREWLLKRYASSTFNTCPHRPLGEMDGPPLEIHVDDPAFAEQQGLSQYTG